MSSSYHVLFTERFYEIQAENKLLGRIVEDLRNQLKVHSRLENASYAFCHKPLFRLISPPNFQQYALKLSAFRCTCCLPNKLQSNNVPKTFSGRVFFLRKLIRRSKRCTWLLVHSPSRSPQNKKTLAHATQSALVQDRAAARDLVGGMGEHKQ